MIEVRTRLRCPDGHFILVDDGLVPAPADPQYVEGAIELVVDGNSILDLELWDYVDQLWAYIVDALLALEREGNSSTYFPDQPLKLLFSRKGGGLVLISLEHPRKPRRAVVVESELVSTLQVAGVFFFEKMIELLPVNSSGYTEILRKLSALNP